MIRKVLIAEDHESANISVQKTLDELGISEVDHVYYCDDALLRIREAMNAGDSYDLLITDLSFEEDQRTQTISDGVELIAAARSVQPDLRVLVFSAESRPMTITALFRDHEIDGFVRKARHDANELRRAFEKIANNMQHYPRQYKEIVEKQDSHQFTIFDITIISLLAQGVPQKNIPDQLRSREIKPSGLSSVEKRLNHIRTVFGFNKNEQLVAYCKDMGII